MNTVSETILTDKNISIEVINEILARNGYNIKLFNLELGCTSINGTNTVSIMLVDNNKLLSIFSTYYLPVPYDQFDMLNLLQNINNDNKYLKAVIDNDKQDMEIDLSFSINVEGGGNIFFLIRKS